MDLDDDFFGLNKEPVTAVSKNKKSILDSSDDEDGEPSFSFLKTDTKKGIEKFHFWKFLQGGNFYIDI